MPSALDDPTLLDELARQAPAVREQMRQYAPGVPRYDAEFPGPPEAARPGATYSGPPEAPRPGDTYSGPPEGPAVRVTMPESYEGPPEAARPGDTYSGPPEGPAVRIRGINPSPPGSALEAGQAGLEPVDSRRFGPPTTAARMVAGDQMSDAAGGAVADAAGAAASALGRAAGVLPPQVDMPAEPAMTTPGRDTDPLTATGTEGKPKPAVEPAKGAPATVTSAPAGTATPVKTEAPKPGATPRKRQMYGAPSASATQGDQPVPMTPRASIHPRAYVDLAQSNPALYNAITEAAATADVPAWDLTNVMMAASGGDPGASKNGRIGLTGLTREDVARYQQRYPQLFENGHGPDDPATNLILGAFKLKEKYAEFGTRSDAAIAAYHAGSDTVNAASRLPLKDQRVQLGPDTYNWVAQVTNGSATPPDKAPTPAMTGAGTGTPQGYAAAAVQSAKTGDTRPFTSYAVQHAPAGMSTTDLWRQAQFSLEMAFLSKGNIEGAQRAREMVFQQSQVGTTQELMKAHAAMRNNDQAGMATHLARAYFHAPDGGQAQFTITKNGVWGQRYNENNGDPVGNPFKVTEEGILAMLNVTQDPVAYAKHVREEQKSLAELADKKSLARWRDVTQPMIAAGHDATRIATNAASNERATAIAQQNRDEATRRTIIQQQAATARLGQREEGEWGRLGYKSQADYDRAMDVAGLRQPGGAAGAPTDKQINDEIGIDAMGLGIATPDKVTPAFQKYGAYYHGLRSTGTMRPQAQSIADGLTKEKYGLVPFNDGSGRVAVVDKKNPKLGIAYLPPDVAARVGIGTAPATPPAGTPAPASAGR